jgi:integrase
MTPGTWDDLARCLYGVLIAVEDRLGSERAAEAHHYIEVCRHYARPAQHPPLLPPDHPGRRLGYEWVTRELPHTFVSIMSAGGVPVEEIARLTGHQQASTAELVYRHELRPVITADAELMDRIFGP